ncbi:MAG: hypothetical protein R2744_13415 [Bacteroidales bacterium]
MPYAAHGGDEDADPANELQTISKTGNLITLSLGGGLILMRWMMPTMISEMNFQYNQKRKYNNPFKRRGIGY